MYSNCPQTTLYDLDMLGGLLQWPQHAGANLYVHLNQNQFQNHSRDNLLGGKLRSHLTMGKGFQIRGIQLK